MRGMEAKHIQREKILKLEHRNMLHKYLNTEGLEGEILETLFS